MKVIAGIIAILIIWVMWPHVRQGEFLAPDPIAPDTWMASSVANSPVMGGASDYAQALATPPQGYGFRHFDTWNDPSLAGRPATKSDFVIKY